jgi:hypothetical protein
MGMLFFALTHLLACLFVDGRIHSPRNPYCGKSQTVFSGSCLYSTLEFESNNKNNFTTTNIKKLPRNIWYCMWHPTTRRPFQFYQTLGYQKVQDQSSNDGDDDDGEDNNTLLTILNVTQLAENYGTQGQLLLSKTIS